MIIEKHIESKIKRDYFFIKGTLKDINVPYFINKINKGIEESTNLNFKTNINGLMTSWDYFTKDEEFYKIINTILNYTEQKNILDKKCTLKDCWGLKEGFANYTKEHDHSTNVFSGVIYLSEVSQSLIFPEINEVVKAKEGSFAIFSSYLKHKTDKRMDEFKYKYGLSFNFTEVAY
jgi:hypothetical protein